MPYNPTYPPQNKEDLVRWLADELTRINPDILVDQEFFSFSPLSVEPSRPALGEIKWADGVGWDPGAGMGLYEYIDLGWSKLGGGNGNVIPTSHGALQGLDQDDHPQYHNDARADARYYTKPTIDARVLNSLYDCSVGTPDEADVLTYNFVLDQWVALPAQGGPVVDPGTEFNVDGGRSDSIYTLAQYIDGGIA